MNAIGDRHFYQPRDGHRLAHDPFNSIIAPRPIGWISTRSTAGVLNLAPYSFFNAVNYVPPLIAFSSVGFKDTVRNARETGEFCWNLATRALAGPMNVTCTKVAPDVDEFELAGLIPRASMVIRAPHVAEAPVVFECRVTDIHQLRGADRVPVDTWLTIGEVVGVHIDPALIIEGTYRTAAADPILRGGGDAEYFGISAQEAFRMERPSD